MVNSSERKLTLSGWLKNNLNGSYSNSLKLQKFLFLYEMYTKADGEQPELSYLRGYKQGPVFSNVFGDYTHDRPEFDSEAEKKYCENKHLINIERAKKVGFLTSVLTEKELSKLTHQMNIWKAKKGQIDQGIKQVSLSENDFNDNDQSMMKMLQSLYPIELIDNSVVINIDQHYFVLRKQDAAILTDIQYDTLWTLSLETDIQNPVFIAIDEEGRLLVD